MILAVLLTISLCLSLVTLSGEDYRGIFLQVRDGNDLASTQRVGAWNIPSSFYQHVACDNPSSSALGHNSRDIKSTSQVFTWTPPDTCDSSTTYQIRWVAFVELR